MTAFELWAPKPSRVRIRVGEHTADLERSGDWWRVDLPDAVPGTDYAYLLDDDPQPLPDPRAAWLPNGVHEPGRVYDHGAYRWTDGDWTGKQLPGSVLYELHVGTFTPQGTFDAAIERLDHLVELGVDLVELLPVNSFNGPYNWGYDGVAWYAVHEQYGGPDGLKRFVDACHRRGVGVALDVVYNHFGPSGNYLPRFGPYLKEGRNTWGDLVNLDGPNSDEVRRYILDNILGWFRDFHVDALRLDAVHALADTRAAHLLEEASREVDVLSTHVGRPLSLIAESDLNDPTLMVPVEAGGYGLTAAWDDDVHHALHALLTGERSGYYRDFGSLSTLTTVLTSAYLHAGTYSSFRERVHGRPVDRRNTPGYRFVVSLQNHDQIGNRAIGDRLSATLSPGLLTIGAALMLTSPFTPMLFMGEEWGASTPWQYFTSHPEPDLATAVENGRKSEFAAYGWGEADVPSPQDPATFERSKLDWTELEKPPHAGLLDAYRRLIALRRSVSDLSDPRLDRVAVEYDDHSRRLVVYRGERHAVAVNLAGEAQAIPLAAPVDAVLFGENVDVEDGPTVWLPPESVAVLRL
ncbi:malto-oligosyltrehalose trehalohydrolase [Cryptosporangium aurantiacum]|uniref:Malto-oligosyltrehalose trehalohydrolase n=1 Tax=Cryptosporangium aurantiacum TaxID=134849 RepID=A0A1M7RPI5_9ACTN|nr:malto-oligosyltrehalose trehalohydrolase [Cryptosporangium aurantiacum]SHN48016.1 maltooligosyl trehalose hydrolase [Cryptosporangium aurantiacum]